LRCAIVGGAAEDGQMVVLVRDRRSRPRDNARPRGRIPPSPDGVQATFSDLVLAMALRLG